MKVSTSEKMYRAIAYLIVTLVAISALFPLFYVVGMSMTTQTEILQRGGFVIFPRKPTLAGYKQAITGITRPLLVSTIRTIFGTFLTLIMTTIGAYVCWRKTLPGRNFFILMVLITILFHASLIPNYLVIMNLGMLDTLWALIIPGAVDSWGLLVIKQFFEGQPEELFDAAKVDGANEWQLMTRIAIPLAAPVLAAIGLFDAVGHWNAWFDALMYISNTNLYPLQLVLRNLLLTSSGLLQSGGTGEATMLLIPESMRLSPDSMKMVVVVVSTLPILAVYPFLQKYFTKGVYLGAVKG